MELMRIFELAAIIVVSCLLVLFASLYFMLTKKQKKLAANDNANDTDMYNIYNKDNMEAEENWVEQLQIIHAQLDLIYELGPVFAVCYDYTRECFSISENGRNQLGLPENAGQNHFEELIHADDIFVYEEVTEAENIRKAELAESPYILKLKSAGSQEYREYLARLKPVYDANGISAALVIAFINVDYIKKT